MLDAHCSSLAGGMPPEVDVILAISDDADASKEALGQTNALPDATTVLDLLVHDPQTTVPEPRNLVSTIVSLATSHLRSPHSKRAYRQAVMEFMAWCTCTGTTKITKAAVQEYVGELNRLRMSPATVNLALYALRKLVSELADSGLMSTESAAKVLSIKGPRRHGFACRRTTICLQAASWFGGGERRNSWVAVRRSTMTMVPPQFGQR